MKSTTTTAPTVTQEQSSTTNTMEQDLFQFFDSLSQPSPVGDWFTSAQVAPVAAAATTTAASAHSSPEIATPLDTHLSPSEAKSGEIPPCAFGSAIGVGASAGDVGADLDMSEILNSPIFDSPVNAMTPAMTPATPHIDMFSDLNQDLPSALAAFVAAVSSAPSTVASGAASTRSTFTPTAASVTGSTAPSAVQSLHPSSSPAVSSSSSASPIMSHKRSTPADETPLDEAALKRQKNTDAARRSRLKKVMKMEAYEKRVNELERMNAQLLLRVAVLDSEKSHLLTKEASHESRIKTLEAQLAEAHKALASRSS